MPITVAQDARVFTLHTNNTTYQFRADERGILQHLYYGPLVTNTDFTYLWQPRDRGFSGNPADAGSDRRISFDTMPLEYPCHGCGDYREPCLEVRNSDGSNSVDLRYVGYKIIDGKPDLPGLPAVFADADQAQTLQITLADSITKIRTIIQYSVLPSLDVITRSVRIENVGASSVTLERVLSCCLDIMQPDSRDIVSFYGRHAGERTMERVSLHHGQNRIESTRGASSLHFNPGIILCNHTATETSGSAYAFLFVYSGSFMAQAGVDQIDQTRIVMGIHPQDFAWELQPGHSFQAPEVVLSYSAAGFETLTHNLHRLINRHIIRGKYAAQRRPILLNSWEAAYFEYDDEKILSIAKGAADLGAELFVLDDGWFSRRDGDTSSLGDWFVNTDKIRCGLPSLCKKINALGLKFGIWVEPEMISRDSDLYRLHPDWMLSIPGRKPISSRCQFVLDMSRQDVVDYLFETFSNLLSSCNIEYLKWDMNRNISDIWSHLLPAKRQGEVLHRYMLGVYDLLQRLTSKFPDVLLETCSGGGGRFDAGMLYYSPQIWCSDNTDPIDRTAIQYGTSFLYPFSCISAHVSASPNHQTGRTVPMEVRGAVAMTGSFGYELDPTQLTSHEKEQIGKQIADYKENWELYSYGTLYRLLPNPANGSEAAWMQVSSDKCKAALTYLLKSPVANAPVKYLKLRGLDPKAIYSVNPGNILLSGAALMHAGLPVPELRGDYPVVQFILTQYPNSGESSYAH